MRTLLLLLLLMVPPVMSHAQIRLAAYAVGTAVEVEHATLRLAGTLAMPVVGTVNTGDYTLEAGFWFAGLASQPTPIEVDPTADVPDRVQLDGNYPNPFNPQTTISYGLPQAGPVRLTIYDALGREVAVLVDREQAAGRYRATFEAGDRPSGAYFYRLEAGAIARTGTMLLLK